MSLSSLLRSSLLMMTRMIWMMRILLPAPFTRMKLSQKPLELSRRTPSRKFQLRSALSKRVAAISRVKPATTTKSSSTKPTMRMRLLSEDLSDPSAPKDALLMSRTRDLIFQLLVPTLMNVVLRSPIVPVLHSSALAAPTSHPAVSQMLRELSAPHLMRLALIHQAVPIFLNVSLPTPAVLKAPLALTSQPAPTVNSPPELDLPSSALDPQSIVPPLATNALTNLSALKVEANALRSQAVPLSLSVPYPSVSDLISLPRRANAPAFLLDPLAVVPPLLVLLDALTAPLSACPIVADQPLRAELVV